MNGNNDTLAAPAASSTTRSRPLYGLSKKAALKRAAASSPGVEYVEDATEDSHGHSENEGTAMGPPREIAENREELHNLSASPANREVNEDAMRGDKHRLERALASNEDDLVDTESNGGLIHILDECSENSGNGPHNSADEEALISRPPTILLPPQSTPPLPPSPSLHEPTTIGNIDLAVARLVEGSSAALTIEEAQQVDPEDLQRQEMNEKKGKVCTLVACSIIVICCVVLAITLGLLMGNKKDEKVDPVTTSTVAPELMSLESHVLSLLPGYTQESIEEDATSPQSKAFNWLVADPNLVVYSEERIIQRFALGTLYFATNGDGWRNNTNWLNYSVHECDWYTQPEFAMKSITSKLYPGYLSTFYSQETPEVCNWDGLYQHLWLDINNLVGFLPDELYLLTHLETISFGLNHGLLPYGATLSSHIGKLSNLQALVNIALPMAGTIPTEVGLLTDLRALGIEGPNQEQASIPTQLWQLTNLEYLTIVRYSQLTGTIPSVQISELSNLRWLLLDKCDLSGTLPSELGQLKMLEYLILNLNRLTGNIPSELGHLSELQMLGAYGNSLEGTLPRQLGSLEKLYLVSLRENQLTGPIPSELGLLTSLSATLELRNNRISGAIPTELGQLKELQELELLNNELSGQIPSQLGQLTRMGRLTFSNNSLSGMVPQELSALEPLLHTLYLEGNPLLSGSVPEAICNINGTCIGHRFDPCEGPYGLSFDCTSQLCGCGCSCPETGDQGMLNQTSY